MVVAIEKRLIQESLQCSYYDKFAKTFNIEKGIIGDYFLFSWTSLLKLNCVPHKLTTLHYVFSERTLNISCKDSFSQCVILLHSNLCHVGELKSNYFQFGRHDLTHCYISCGPPQLKCPSIPYASGSGNGDLEGSKKMLFFVSVVVLGLISFSVLSSYLFLIGYNFTNKPAQLASYHYVLEQMQRLTSAGSSDFSFDTWLSGGKNMVMEFHSIAML